MCYLLSCDVLLAIQMFNLTRPGEVRARSIRGRQPRLIGLLATIPRISSHGSAGTSMPDMLASKSTSEKNKIAEALTHFLVAQSKSVAASEPIDSIDRPTRQRAIPFHWMCCMPRTKGIDGPTPRTVRPGYEDDEDEIDANANGKSSTENEVKPSEISLAHVSEKYSVKSLADFLFEPLKVRSSGRMPDMKLTPAESIAIAAYLVGRQRSR